MMLRHRDGVGEPKIGKIQHGFISVLRIFYRFPAGSDV